MTFLAHLGAPGRADASLLKREMLWRPKIGLALAIAQLAFVALFWCFSDPITGILAAIIALFVQMIFFAFVTGTHAGRQEEMTDKATWSPNAWADLLAPARAVPTSS
jgi:hypothetical protein